MEIAVSSRGLHRHLANAMTRRDESGRKVTTSWPVSEDIGILNLPRLVTVVDKSLLW